MTQPQLTRAQAVEFLKNNFPSLDPSKQVIVMGMRGYFDPGANKRGIYDDAIALISPTAFAIYNGNTDPSIAQAGIAVLQDGIYYYKKGLHGLHHLDMSKPEDRALLTKLDNISTFQQTWKDIEVPGRIIPYWALRQDSDVTVKRDGATGLYTDMPPRPRMWIDIHVGGYNVTSSDGCQTLYPIHWPDFRKLVFTQMDLHSQQRIPYALKTLALGIESRPAA